MSTHDHNSLYYLKSEVDSFISSSNSCIDELELYLTGINNIYDGSSKLDLLSGTQIVMIYADAQAKKTNNFPVDGEAGILIVYAVRNSASEINPRYAVQMYFTRSSHNLYTRNYDINTWSSWIKRW